MISHLNKLLRDVFTAALIVFGIPANAQDAATELPGPDAVVNLLAQDDEDKPDVLDIDEQAVFDAWKQRVKQRTGLDFGLDYNVLGYAATNSIGDDTTAGGVFRIFGSWDLFRRGTPNSGSVVFKFENRHAYTDVSPSDFGDELGYVGYPSSVFSDQDWRVTHLFWRQSFAQGRGVSYLGFLDVTDYVDVYALASPWSAFSNLVFQNGSGTIGGLPDGALGVMAGGFLNHNFYAIGGIVDANADATDILSGFDTFFDDFETFKTFEFGWTRSDENPVLDNAHLTFWQIDEREASGKPDGWGVSFSVSGGYNEAWLPFLRGGWSEDGASLYEASVSAGFGYTSRPEQSLLGIGVNWGRPNETTFGAGLDDQITVEVFQQVQLTEGIAITPSLQFIRNPALNAEDDQTLLFGFRIRAAI